jgi:hypothetical protein
MSERSYWEAVEAGDPDTIADAEELAKSLARPITHGVIAAS